MLELLNRESGVGSDGVIVGTPRASFEEEMETKITFAGGRISLGTFNHENMHQWWGDNVAASLTRYTYLKEGMANLGERLNTARTAATNAGGYGFPAGDAAFDASLVNGGRGLVGMRERVALLGGQLDVTSDPAQGTRVSATVPVRGV